MKKMVCEICESTSIQKENGIFVCKECGAKYLLEDAKKLLREVDEIGETNGNVSVVNSISDNNYDENELIKLKYDLQCWLMFFEKCHDLEESFEILPDDYDDKKEYIDPVERQLNWNKNIDIFYNDKVYPKIKDKFMKTHKDANEKYQNHIKACKKREDEIDEINKQRINKNTKIKTIGVILVIISFLFAFFGTIIFAFAQLPLFLPYLICLCIGIPGGLMAISKVEYISEPDKTIPKKLDVFLKENIGEYNLYVKNYKNKFISECNKRKSYIEDNIPALAEIKHQLENNTEIPAKYCNEHDIKCLLILIMDKRATSLKEVLNLYEVEKHQNKVINKLDNIDSQLQDIKREIQNVNQKVTIIGTVVNEKLNCLIKQNLLISNQLSQINYLAKQNIVATVLSD